MAEEASSGGKNFQLAVMGGLAVVVVVMIGIVLAVIQTPTITTAMILLGLGILLTIGYLVFEL